MMSHEKGQTQLFCHGFFQIFGVHVRRVAAFEEPVNLLGAKRGFVDLLWKGLLLGWCGNAPLEKME